MKHVISLYLCWLGFATLHAQVSENFNDGEINTNPTWTGNTGDFTVTASGQLRSNNTNTNTAFAIATSNTLTTNCQWEFWCNLQFNPSGANYVDVYLVSNNSNLLSPSLNAYFVRLGGSTDEVSLYVRNGSTSTKIIDGADGTLNSSSNTLKVKVTRDAANLWTLHRDPGGSGTSYIPEGSITDATFTSGTFCGILVQQSTASFFQKHFLDDLIIGPIIQDITPPAILTATLNNMYQLDLSFDENLDLTSSQTFSNYVISPGIGNPSSAVRNAVNTKQVRLYLPAGALVSGTTYTLNISQVQDLYGNAISSGSITFSYYKAHAYDVVINEIMADPSPIVGLPDAEYIELKNRSGFALNLQDWSLSNASSQKKLPVLLIQPDSFVVLTSTGTASVLATLGITAYDLSSFPSLSNSSGSVALRDSSGQLIHNIQYGTDWYHDALKQNGGWSLEQIDPSNACGGADNWRASMNPAGGTPGSRNSVNSNNPDTHLPALVRIAVPAKDTVLLFFSESLDSLSLLSPGAYQFDNSLGPAQAVIPLGPEFRKVKLALSSALQAGIMYHCSIQSNVSDCAGNLINIGSAIPFALPDTAAENDVVINEILFNPRTGSYDFVELYNRSGKVLDLKQLHLCNYDTVNTMPVNPVIIDAEGYLLFPGDYMVCSENQASIRSIYNTPNPDGFIDLSAMPPMSQDEGTIGISDVAGNNIDHIVYNDVMHFPLLIDHKGVSLERIDFNRPSNDRTNWNSAAQAVGFATPAYRNSQYMASTENTSHGISMSNPLFSPDNDGYQDVLDIQYHLETSGMAGNVWIYDSKGREIRRLLKNEQLMQSGTFSWNGMTDTNEKAPIGLYIVYAEIFSPTGSIHHFKLSCVLAGKLK